MNRLRASELVPQSSEEWSRVDESLQALKLYMKHGPAKDELKAVRDADVSAG